MFGEFLIRKGKIGPEELEKGLATQRDLNLPIGETLVKLGFIEVGELDMLVSEFIAHKADELIGDDSIWEEK